MYKLALLAQAKDERKQEEEPGTDEKPTGAYAERLGEILNQRTRDASKKAATEWIKIDLLRKSSVGLVRITSTAANKAFIEGAKVYVDGALCGTVGALAPTSVNVECTSTLVGSVVVVAITTSDSVTKIYACEIEVYEGWYMSRSYTLIARLDN